VTTNTTVLPIISTQHSTPLPNDHGVITPPNHGVARSAFGRVVPRRARWHRIFVGWLVVLDFMCAQAASQTAIFLFAKAASGFGDETTFLGLSTFSVVANVGLPLGWLALLAGVGAYDRRAVGIGSEEVKRVFRATIAMAALVSFLAFAFKTDLSRMTVVVVIGAAMFYTLVGRMLARVALHTARRWNRATSRMLLVGRLSDAQLVYDVAVRNRKAGLLPIGIHIPDFPKADEQLSARVPIYAGWDIVPLVQKLGADTIAVCGQAGLEPTELRRLAWQIEGTGLDLVVVPQVTDVAGPRVHVRPVEGLPLLHVDEPTLSGVSLLAKSLLDRVVAIVLLTLLGPLLLVIAAIIRLADRGPAIFRQRRIGFDGRAFRVWKFRTMYVDAERRLAALQQHNESDGLLFKMKDDPRITRVGRFLRKFSLDELPQLVNVVKGEMSLVGPRPLPTDDNAYEGDVRRRLLVRPGITGLWQVSGRSDLSWEESVRLDLYYVDNWSLSYDLGILWRTVWVVLGRRGAY
jgi:exopolysaccharide biosynthesis polyprenyl glycosylphosphotransferase